MQLFKSWVTPLAAKCILFALLVPNMIMFFLPVANEEVAASYYGVEVNDIQFMVSLYYVGFAGFYSLERRFYAYLKSKQYFIVFQLLQLVSCYVLFEASSPIVLYAIRFFQGMLFASAVNLYLSLVMPTMKTFRAKEMSYSIFFGMLLCTGAFNNLITADLLDHYNFGLLYLCAILLYSGNIALVLIVMKANVFIRSKPLIQLDMSSFILLSTALMSAGYLSIYGQQYYWLENTNIRLAIVITLASTLVFILRQSQLKRPYIHLEIFRFKEYWWGIGLLFLMYIERFSFSFSGNFFRQILGMDPRHVSYIYVFNLVGIISGVAIAALWLIKKKPSTPLWLLGFGSLFGYHFTMRLLMYSSGNEYYYFAPMFTHGLGIGLIMVPTILHCISVVPHYLAPSAAAFCLIIRFSGYTVSTILIKYYTLFHYQEHYTTFLESITTNNNFYLNKLAQVQLHLKGNGLNESLLASVSQKVLRSMVDKHILLRSIMDYYSMMLYLSLIIIATILVYSGVKKYKHWRYLLNDL